MGRKDRCVTCGKKVGLMKFQCKCGAITCSSHRDIAGHTCSFDYKTHDRNILQTKLQYEKNKQIEEIEDSPPERKENKKKDQDTIFQVLSQFLS